MNETYSPEWHEHRRALYVEEVQKIVDGVVEDVKAGKVASPNAFVDQLSAAVRASAYTNDADLIVECVKYATQASAGLITLAQEIAFGNRTIDPQAPLPWQYLATRAMCADAIQLVDSCREVDTLFGRKP